MSRWKTENVARKNLSCSYRFTYVEGLLADDEDAECRGRLLLELRS